MPKDTPIPNGGTDEETVSLADTADRGDDGRGSDRGGDDLDAILDQFGQGGAGYRLQLERVDQVDGNAYLGTLPLNSQLVEIVEQRYGGGRYGGKIVDGRSKYVRRMPQFRIAGEPRDPRAAPATPAAASSETGNIVQAIAAALSGFRESVIDAIRAAQPAPVAPAPPVDPLAMITQVATLVTSLQPKQSGDLVGQMRDLLELQRELQPERGESSGGVADAIREYAPIVKQALENRQPDHPRVSEPQHQAALPAPAAPAVAEWLRPFMQYRQLLLTFADQGKDPALYGGLLADNVSDDQATLIAQAQSAGTLERDLFAAIPQLNQSADRRRFAGALLKTLRAELFGEAKMRRSAKRPRASKAAKKPTTAGADNGK